MPVVTTGGAVVCGSRGEVANDPTLGDSWLAMSSINFFRETELSLPRDFTPFSDFARQREFVWSEIALKAPDQLVRLGSLTFMSRH
jgi:hypothetical protein